METFETILHYILLGVIGILSIVVVILVVALIIDMFWDWRR